MSFIIILNMEINKDLVIAGIIGGITALGVQMIARRFIWGRRHGRRWGGRGQAQIIKM